MQRPPGSLPPILSSRPTYEWINRVDRKLEELKAIQGSPGSGIAVAPWLEVDFAFSALKLAGARVERGRVEELARAEKVTASENDREDVSDDASILRLLRALRLVISQVTAEGRKARLTPDLLLSSDGKPDGAPGEFRKGLASQVIENACLWFTAGSFDELHPLEQASIVHLRLVELRPFEEENEQLSLSAASLFTLRSGLPPLIISEEAAGTYRAAIDEGLRMNTKPMVELMAGVIEKTLGDMIRLAAKK